MRDEKNKKIKNSEKKEKMVKNEEIKNTKKNSGEWFRSTVL